ncbi:MAG: hypothetical protein GEV28_34550 [Actinophytocola sp.]|uniref:hypothetical protein n=1 Tax=Actinophytocola sp. TaxID=1872138 RepID=UPI001329E83A|nr:hypothetical protein [Actinophytocola sp.]MPZ85236.1 hypothetical protein [Actinophytocola sp.]
MSVGSLGMTLAEHDSVRLRASRSEELAWLVIEADETHCEIRMDRAHVEALRDHLPDVLAGLDRWSAEDAACEQAEVAGGRAVDAAAEALDMAARADAAGAHDVAAPLREAAAEMTAKADAVDAAVRAFGNAAADADYAAERLSYATREAERALCRWRDDDRPAELVER